VPDVAELPFPSGPRWLVVAFGWSVMGVRGSAVVGVVPGASVGRGPRRAPPPPTTFWPFPVPYAGGSIRTRSGIPGAFHGLRQIHTGSGPSRSCSCRSLYDAAELHAADRPVVPPRFDAGLSTDDEELGYRGPRRLPGPDSRRLAVESFALGCVMTAPLRLRLRASGRTRIEAKAPRRARPPRGRGSGRCALRCPSTRCGSASSGTPG
jgi:hypothetical protein